MEWKQVDLPSPATAPTQMDVLQVTLPPGAYSIQIGERGIKAINKVGNHEQVVLIFDKPFAPD